MDFIERIETRIPGTAWTLASETRIECDGNLAEYAADAARLAEPGHEFRVTYEAA